MHECLASSLIPRLLPPPVFDRLQCAKTEGEGLGEIVMCMTSCRHEGRHEGGKPGVDQPRIYRITSCNDAVFRTLQSQVFYKMNLKILHRTPPPSCLPDVMHVTLSPRPSSLSVTASNQNRECLGTRLLATGQWGRCTTERYWQHIGKTLLTTISCKVPFISFCFTIKLFIQALTA